jgi:hypothetical protein
MWGLVVHEGVIYYVDDGDNTLRSFSIHGASALDARQRLH